MSKRSDLLVECERCNQRVQLLSDVVAFDIERGKEDGWFLCASCFALWEETMRFFMLSTEIRRNSSTLVMVAVS